MLAATHLLTLGVLTMVICGALLQLLPVVAGAAIPCAPLSARMMHAPLSLGALLLAGAFLRPAPPLFALALPPLVLALAWLLAACGAALWRVRGRGSGADGRRRAHGAGRAGADAGRRRGDGGGAGMAAARGAAGAGRPARDVGPARLGRHAADRRRLAGDPDVPGHPALPARRHRARWASWCRSCWRHARLAQLAGHALAAPLRALLFGAFALFAVVTLSLLARRKRPAPDATTLFWRLSMASLLACAPAWYAPLDEPARPLLLGVLFLLGFATSAVNGMLYKIVPFLLWHHWQEHGFGRPVPGIRQVIPEARASAQFHSHALAVALLALAALWPAWLLRPAALALVARACFSG